jgi:hypothetical protein
LFQYNDTTDRVKSLAKSYVKKKVRKKILSYLLKLLFTTPVGWIILILLIIFLIMGMFISSFSYLDFSGNGNNDTINQQLYQKYLALSNSTASTDIEKNYKLPWEVIAAIDMVYNNNNSDLLKNTIAQDITDNLKPVFHYKEMPITTTITTVDKDGKTSSQTTTSYVNILQSVDTYKVTYTLKYNKSQNVSDNGNVHTVTEKYDYIGDSYNENYTMLDNYLKKIGLYQDKNLIMEMISQIESNNDIGSNNIDVLPASITNLPQEYINIYKEAGQAYNVDWWVLAGIHGVETGFSNNVAVSSAGAVGPMQFMPLTWSGYSNPFASETKYDTNPNRILQYGGYGLDPNHDGTADPYDLEDAVFAAAKYLKANGYSVDPRGAIYAYNHAWWYVDEVMSYADNIKIAYESGGDNYLYDSDVEKAKNDILTNGRVSFDPSALEDIKSNVVDSKVILLIDSISKQHTIYISSIKGNHTKYVAGTNRISLHYLGKAFDIAAVDGVPVTNQRYIGSPAYKVASSLVNSANQLGIAEVGSPWNFGGISFSDEDHQNHIHVGVK